MAGPAVTASCEAKKLLADFFNAAALPAGAVSHHRRGKRGARIEQRREDRTHVSKHQSREGDGRGVPGLLPPSRRHLGKNRAGRRETERGKYSRKNGGWNGGNRMLRRKGGDAGGVERLLIKFAQLQGQVESRELVVGTYNVRTLVSRARTA